MAGNTRGEVFRVTTWGESHGESIGAVVDGCPPGMKLTPPDIQVELDRRRPGQSDLTTSRDESDRVQIMSGVFQEETLGTPIGLRIENTDARPEDYEENYDVYRPSHADYTYEAKFGLRNWMGGGRASARETASRVAAGAIARKWLRENTDVELVAWVDSVCDVEAGEVELDSLTRRSVESSPVRCPDPDVSREMEKKIEQADEDDNSLGGTVGFVARGMESGWGQPVFDKLESELAGAFLSIPATKGFEVGSGFEGTRLTGSEHNDEFVEEDGAIRTSTNRSGGIQGGISNGMPVYGRVAFKPVATIPREQKTVNRSGEEVVFKAEGRHDPCVLPRAVPIVEAELGLVLIDLILRHRAQTGET